MIEVAALSSISAASLSSKRYITNWQTDSSKSLFVTTPTLSTQGLFRPDRMYFMVGAAGGLGLSLCKWALNNGAKHLVITSCNPSVDPIFLSDAQRLGAFVRVLLIDVTFRESVEGVAQCAMVLQDRLLLDMSSDELNGTLAAKVEGTEILDFVFYQFEPSSAQQGDKPDFCVMLSSSASTVGNIG